MKRKAERGEDETDEEVKENARGKTIDEEERGREG